jgi:hypothetical protein
MARAPRSAPVSVAVSGLAAGVTAGAADVAGTGVGDALTVTPGVGGTAEAGDALATTGVSVLAPCAPIGVDADVDAVGVICPPLTLQAAVATARMVSRSAASRRERFIQISFS